MLDELNALVVLAVLDEWLNGNTQRAMNEQGAMWSVRARAGSTVSASDESLSAEDASDDECDVRVCPALSVLLESVSNSRMRESDGMPNASSVSPLLCGICCVRRLLFVRVLLLCCVLCDFVCVCFRVCCAFRAALQKCRSVCEMYSSR